MFPSVVSSCISSLLLLFLFLYLYVENKEKFLLIWAFSWAAYLIRFILMLLIIRHPRVTAFHMGNQLASVASGFFLMWGSYIYLEKRMRKVWALLPAAIALWVVANHILSLRASFFETLPVYIYLCVIFISVGVVWLRSVKEPLLERRLLGITFIIWGWHKADYPFLIDVEWFAPFGYMLGTVLSILVAFGMALLYFKRSKNEVHQYLNLLDTVIDTIPDLLWMKNGEGKFLYCNKKFAQYVNRDFDSIIGKDDREIFPPEMIDAINRNEQRVKKAGQPLTFEHKITYRSDNHDEIVETIITPMFNQGKEYAGNLGIARDITTRKQIDTEVNTLFESIVGHIGQALFDVCAQRVSSWLDWECVIIGMISDDGTSVQALSMYRDGVYIRDYTYKLEHTPCDNVRQRGFCFYPKDIRALFPLDKDLVEMDAESYVGTPLVNNEGVTCGIFCAISRKKRELPENIEEVLMIIASRLSGEIDRIKTEKKLIHVQKLESIGILAGGIAHDFNNILSPIIGFSELLIEDFDEESDAKDMLASILSSALRAKNLVRQILSFSSKREEKNSYIDMKSEIEDAIELLRATIPSKIEIRSELQKPDGVMLTNSTQLHQIVMNLGTNAYHAMDGNDSGVLEIRLLNVESDDPEIPSESSGTGIKKYALVKVSDTGVGMEAEVVKKIFDPFFTTKESDKGTGMGLAITNNIVRSLGGWIKVDSKYKQGTTFDIYLPLVEANP